MYVLKGVFYARTISFVAGGGGVSGGGGGEIRDYSA